MEDKVYKEKLAAAAANMMVLYVKCTGEAHGPEAAGNIDHCFLCMPYWGSYPICPLCEHKAVSIEKPVRFKYKCKHCKVKLNDNPDKTCVNEKTG